VCVRAIVAVVLLILPGIAAAAIFGGMASQDYLVLMPAYEALGDGIQTGKPLRDIVAADAMQNVHRINVFAEGTWALLGALMASLGVHALLVMRKSSDVRMPPVPDPDSDRA